MTDIIEVAKKCGAHHEREDEAFDYGDGFYFGTKELQAFADHYRKEGAEEANEAANAANRIVAEDYAEIKKLKQQLAATELVVEQMRAAFVDLGKHPSNEDLYASYMTMRNALQLQPSLPALREHDAKVLNELIDLLSSDLTDAQINKIRRLAASKRKEQV